jgi:hypothetical protein
MTITQTSKGTKRATLAERFSVHLDTVTSPDDIGALVRSFELSLRGCRQVPQDHSELFGHGATRGGTAAASRRADRLVMLELGNHNA